MFNYNSLLQKIVFLFLLFLLANCKYFGFGNPGIGAFKAPDLPFTGMRVPAGTPKFRKGYQDGCATALSARGNWLYRQKYNGYQFDYNYIDDKDYTFGHSRGYNTCFFIAVGPKGNFAGGWDKYLFPEGGPVFDMTPRSLDSTINYGSLGFLGKTGGGIGGSIELLGSKNGKSVFGAHPLWGTKHDLLFGF